MPPCHFGFSTLKRAQQCREAIAQYPNKIFIERFCNQWYVMAPENPDIPWDVVIKMLELQPNDGFYCLAINDGSGDMWHLGESWAHVQIWLATGEIHHSPIVEAEPEPKAIAEITEMLRKQFDAES